MYLAQVSRYDILYAVNQLSRAMSKSASAYIGTTKHLLRYLAGYKATFIVYKQSGFRLAAFPDANCGNNPDDVRSTSSYVVMLVAAALTMKKATFCLWSLGLWLKVLRL